MTIQHILVPVDGSTLSEEAALAARDLANRLAARLTVFYALPSADAYAEATLPAFVDREQIAGQELAQIHAQISAAATTYLNALVTRLQQSTKASASSPVGLETAQSDQPHRAILDAAQRLGCDLIVMASHGRRGLSALMLSSETQKLLTHATLPVLVWRPQAAATP